MELLEESGMAEIEIVEGKESVRISRYGNAPMTAAPNAAGLIMIYFAPFLLAA
jgi:acetyl-CoA carboxylase biotin carboxyl carrier protein